MEEIWKDIEGYEGAYQVSNKRRVKRLGNNKKRAEKLMVGFINKRGYISINLSNTGVASSELIK